MDEKQKNCKDLFIYYQFLLKNLIIDIKAMNRLIYSPTVLEKRRFRKPKKTNFMEILKKGKYRIVQIPSKEKEKIDAITKYGNLIDLTQRFYKLGIIVAYVYLEAFIKDIMRVFNDTFNYENFNILVKKGKNKYLEELNNTFNINVKEQYSNWNSLIQGYALRNIIVHNNGKIDKKFLENFPSVKNKIKKIDDFKNLVNYKQAFENTLFVIDTFFEFLLETIGLRVCYICKQPFEDYSNNLDYLPTCQNCLSNSKENN